MNEIGGGRRQRDEVRRPGDESDRQQAGPTGRQVILMVEDSEADRDMYGGLLWYNGYSVEHAGDGPTAVSRALEIGPDLVLLDIMLPGQMDGLEAARLLREQGMSAPIVVLSAHSRDEFGARVEAAGVDAYLEKPVDPFAVVREAIRRIGPARSPDLNP